MGGWSPCPFALSLHMYNDCILYDLWGFMEQKYMSLECNQEPCSIQDLTLELRHNWLISILGKYTVCLIGLGSESRGAVE